MCWLQSGSKLKQKNNEIHSTRTEVVGIQSQAATINRFH